MKLRYVALIGVIAFAVGHYTVPEPEPVTVTEYEERNFSFADVSQHLDYQYDKDRNRLVIRKTGFKELQFGDSMHPTISEGNKYLTTHYSGQKLEPGMIIGAYQPAYDEVWVHRVTKVDEDEHLVWTQGDNNEKEEMNKFEDVRYIVKGVLYTK